MYVGQMVLAAASSLWAEQMYKSYCWLVLLVALSPYCTECQALRIFLVTLLWRTTYVMSDDEFNFDIDRDMEESNLQLL